MHAILKNTLSICVVGFVTSGHATAHAKLVSATPANNETVAVSPAELKLRFAEALEVKCSEVKIVGPTEDTVATGVVSFAKGGKRILTVRAGPICLNSFPGFLSEVSALG